MSDGPDKAVIRAFFDTTAYLQGNPLIPIRAELVAAVLKGVRGGRVLDLGCGDGAVSRRLLRSGNELTLVDFSAAMLERARESTPPGAPVKFIAADVLSYVPDAPYDAVLCVGVLAHLPAIEPMIARIARWLTPGGVCVLQITDDERPLGWALNRYHRLRAKRSTYSMNRMGRSEVVAVASRHGLAFRDARTYALSIPGSGMLPDRVRLGIETAFARSRLSSLGAEALITFERLS